MRKNQSAAMSSQQRIILVFVVSTLASIMLVGGGLYYFLQRAALAQNRTHLESQARMLARQCENEIVEARLDLELMSKMPAFQQLPYADKINLSINGIPENVDTLKRLSLERLLNKIKRFSVIYMLRPNGDIYLVEPYRVQPHLTKYNLSDRPYYREAVRTRATAVSDSYRGADGILAVAILVPIFGQSGEVVCYIGGVFHLSRLSNLVVMERIRPFEAGFLVDRQGSLIAHTDTALLRDGVRESFRERHPALSKFMDSKAGAKSSGQGAVQMVECTDPMENRPHLSALVPLGSGWGLGLIRNKAAVMAEVRPVIWGISSLAGLLLALIGGFGVAIAHGIGRRWENAERSLRISEKRSRIVAESISDVIYEWDLKENIVWFGDVDKLLGYPKGEFPRTLAGWVASLHPDDKARVWTAVERQLKGADPYDVEYRIKGKEGEWCWWSARGTVIRDESGVPGGWTGAVTDITERKRSEEAVRKSEERYRTLVNNLNAGVVVHAADTRILFSNQTASVVLGLTSDQMLGKTAVDPSWYFVREGNSVLPLEEYPVNKVISEKRTLSNYVVGINIPGGKERKWVLCNGFPVFGAEGDIQQAIITFIDISDRMKAEETLRLDESRTATLLKMNEMTGSSPQEITDYCLEEAARLTQSRLGYFAFMNEDETVLTMHAWSKSAMKECSMQDKPVVYPVVKTGLWGEAVRQRKPVITNDYSAPNPLKKGYPQGHVQIVNHMNIPVFDEGKIVLVAGVGNKNGGYSESDANRLTLLMQGMWRLLARKRAEEALQRLNQDLVRSNKELEQFAYVASHDLQEPLRMISSYTQLLAERYKDKIDDKARKYINYAVDGAVRMQRLINDLLAYSRVGTRGKIPEAADAHSALGEAVKNLSAAIDEAHAVVTNGDLPEVRADAAQLATVFQNLVSNAVKFRGDGPPRVHVSAEEKGSDWLFSVRDNGIGIDPQYKEKLFVIFQRLHTQQEYPGTGIGLAICKRIVERHNGRIWFESEPAKGSTFYFTLPKQERSQAI